MNLRRLASPPLSDFRFYLLNKSQSILLFRLLHFLLLLLIFPTVLAKKLLREI